MTGNLSFQLLSAVSSKGEYPMTVLSQKSKGFYASIRVSTFEWNILLYYIKANGVRAQW